MERDSMTILLALLRRYWLHMAVVAIAGLFVWRHDAAVYDWGARDERAKWLTKENAALTQAIADNAKANDERRAAQKEVDRLAKLPAKVIERVRQNPSGCSIPKPVADGLREQVAEINRAIRERGVRGDSRPAR
jgi:hypothetical protein